MFLVGLVVYADLSLLARSATTFRPAEARPKPRDGPTPAINQEELVGEAARITVRLHELALPIPLPTPVEEPLGEAELAWTHRIYELSLPRQTDISSITGPIAGLQKEFAYLTVHTEDRPQSLEVRVGVGGLRTHTLRFHWVDGPPRVALVIAHLGGDIHLVRQLLSLGVPLTYAVRPSEVFSDIVGEQLRLANAPMLVELDLPAAETARSLGAQALSVAGEASEPNVPALTQGLNASQPLFHQASGLLLFSPGPTFAEANRSPVLQQVLPAPHLVVWVNSATGTTTLCVLKEAKKPRCRLVAEGIAAARGERASAQERLLLALAKAKSRGEAIEVLPGTADCLHALRQELPRYKEAGIELSTVPSLETLGLSEEARF